MVQQRHSMQMIATLACNCIVTTQSIPSVPTPPTPFGICHFCLEKMQMPHGGAGRFIQKPHGGALKKGENAPPKDNTKIAFSGK